MISNLPRVLDPFSRELVLIAVAVIAIVLPFLNGVLAGPPAPDASMDLRYVLVVGGATLGLLATIAWRAGTAPVGRRRIRMIAVAIAVLPVVIALQAPRDPFWVSIVTLELLVIAPLVALGAAYRFARVPGFRQTARIAGASAIILVLLGPWLTLTWGLVSVQLSIALVRL